MSFRKVARRDELWSGEMRAEVIDGFPVLLVAVGDEVYAYEDRCVHQGVALSEGTLEGKVITCGAHAWQYDAVTGEGVNPRGVRLRRLPSRVEGDVVLVDLPDEGEVGPVLESGPVADAVIAAIRALNPGASALDRGGYVRVRCPSPCRVTRLGDQGERAGDYVLGELCASLAFE